MKGNQYAILLTCLKNLGLGINAAYKVYWSVHIEWYQYAYANWTYDIRASVDVIYMQAWPPGFL